MGSRGQVWGSCARAMSRAHVQGPLGPGVLSRGHFQGSCPGAICPGVSSEGPVKGSCPGAMSRGHGVQGSGLGVLSRGNNCSMRYAPQPL